MLELDFKNNQVGSIDFTEMYEELRADGLLPIIQQELATKLHENVVKLVDKNLYSTKEAYLKALELKKEQATLTLDVDSFLVNMVEEGVDPFDMKPGLLSGPKVKIGKNGQRYTVVPLSKFKHGKYAWRDRSTGRFSKGTNNGPVEFRIVSDKSDPNSFQHPGFKGFKFLDVALEELNNDAEVILARYFDKE